mgnify:CR=1 FL=1
MWWILSKLIFRFAEVEDERQFVSVLEFVLLFDK